MSITPKDILAKAREILADEKSWVREMWAYDPSVSRMHVMPGDADFVDMPCFCLHGAIYAAAKRMGLHHHDLPSDHASGIVSDVIARDYDDLFEYDPTDRENIGYETPIHDFNDHDRVRHGDILAVLDKAIDIAKGKTQ